MQKLCRRTIYLAGLGLVYNSVGALLGDRPIRFPGVLQRIALSSFVSAIQPFWTWLFPFVATGVWWYTSIRFYNNDCAALEGVEGWFSPPNCTAQSTIDYMAVGKEHMYSPDYDPEGLLSTITTAAVTVCAGFPQLYQN
jgi:predicted acyltransferase